MRKELLHMMLELHNVRMEPTCDKNRANAMLVLLNMTIKPSNLRKKKNGTTICDKRTVKYDIEIAQCDNGTVKCEKKKKKPPNVRK